MSVLNRSTDRSLQAGAVRLPSCRVLWVAPADLLGLGRGDARFGWVLRAEAEGSVVAEAILPEGLDLNGQTPRLWPLRVSRDQDLLHLDPEHSSPEAPRFTLRETDGSLGMVYARSDLATRLGLAGGRYEPTGVVMD